MSTHAVIGLKMPNGDIMGCYVHYDGATIFSRLHSYLEKHTTTDLAMVISKGQACGGIRSFYHPEDPKFPHGGKHPLSVTEFLDDQEAYLIDHNNWNDDHYGAHYKFLVNYDSAEINPNREWKEYYG
jgi:hypothetical protein